MEQTHHLDLPHVIVIPSPGMGHLIPVAEFTKRLVLDHGFSATLIIPTETNSQIKALKQALHYLPSAINTVFLPPVDISKVTEHIAQLISTVNQSLPALADAVRTITSTHRVVSFVVDLFCTDAIDVAKEFNIDAYILCASTAMLLSLVYYSPKLDQVYSCEFRDVPEPIQIPGCVPIRGIDLAYPLQDRKSEAYNAWFIQYWKQLNLGRGIFVNSFEEIEHGALGALNGKQWDNPPVYAIGPLIRTGARSDGSSGCLKWLDNQPPGSVLFVSFGSGGTLSGEQLTELAFGLEMSKQKFLWLLKRPTPSDKSAAACYLNAQIVVDDPSEILPKGFLDRTRNSGLVFSSWAPQIEILSHVSTGGFLTHCGWNSTLESIVHGVPLIAWPLFAEQTMNAVMLTDDMKVALRPKPMENGIIGRDEICKVVKELMEGEQGKRLRSNMGELKRAATSTIAEGGSSFETFAEVVNAWKKH